MLKRLAIDLRPLIEPRESGVRCFTREMTLELLRRDSLEVDLFYQSRKRIEHIHDLFPQVRHIKRSNFLFHFTSLFRTPTLKMSDFDQVPDLIWLPDRRPFYRTHIPLVLTIHDSVPELYMKSLSFKGKLWHMIFSKKRLLRLADGVLVPSLSTAQAVPRGLAKEIIYEGAELSDRKTAPCGSEIYSDKEFFLSIAPADPRKRLDLILAAAKHFKKSHFVIAGLKPKDRRFASLSLGKLQNVHMLGEFTEPEKAWLLSHAKALLALSEHEGFDLPVLEAYLAKCPAIMSDIAVHRELYKSACFVADEADLFAAIHRANSGGLALHEPRLEFSWKRSADRALLFFRSIVRNKDR
jgi:glycosyltransferase involved in cell wall biosynthesis